MQPLVSIIIPTYNRAHLIGETIDSVIAQTYTNWECIIVDDGSTDETSMLVNEYVNDDNRFQFFTLNHKGVSYARNYALSKISGDYIQFVDSDDLIHENKLKNALDNIEVNDGDKYDIVISNFMMFRESVDKLLPPFCQLNEGVFNFNTALYNWDFVFNIPIHCGFFHKNFFQDFRFSEVLGAKEDWIMWLNLFKSKPKICFINQPLAYYRYHSNNMTKNSTHMKSNFFNSLPIVREMIPNEDFEVYLYFLIDKFYQLSKFNALEIKKYKHSNSYKLGQKVKLFLQKIYLLKFSKRLFKL